MNVKRILTALIGLPLVILVLVFGNKYVIDVAIAVIAIIGMYEYSKCIASEAKFIPFVGYIAAALIVFIHIVPTSILNTVLTLGVPLLLFAIFSVVVITNMKYTFKDAAFSFIGIFYIVGFLGFLPILYGVSNGISGKILIWYVLFTSWGSDSFAYWVGKNLGKHKFSKVSPNKTIEGCIGGVLGAIVFSLIGTLIINNATGVGISYLKISVLSAILSLIGQMGDFSASTIKRYFDIKDFSKLFPGHGGMLDRVDSIMFIAPFAYFLLTMCL